MRVLRSFAMGFSLVALAVIIPLATTNQANGQSVRSEGHTLSPRDEYNLQRPTRVAAEERQAQLLDFYIAAKANIDEQNRIAAEAQRAAQAARQREYQRTHQSTTNQSPTVTGSCAAMAPAGFPSYIIQRESGGDPNAYNSSSGARGCAQILDSHFRSGAACAGLGYAECWAKLWAGGAGASHWACTPESGCG